MLESEKKPFYFLVRPIESFVDAHFIFIETNWKPSVVAMSIMFPANRAENYRTHLRR